MYKLITIMFISCLAMNVSIAKTVKIGTEGAYPPFNNIDSSGKLIGYDIDIANAVCAINKWDCQWVTQDWDGIFVALDNRKYDIIIAGVSITEERKKAMLFSIPYGNDNVSFVASVDSEMAGIDSIEDIFKALSNKTVGVQVSTVSLGLLEQQVPNTKIKQYEKQDEMVADLVSGRIDVGLADSTSWQNFLQGQGKGGFKQIGPLVSGQQYPVLGSGFGAAVRKNDKELLTQFNYALRKIKRNGTATKLSNKWFGFDIITN